MTIDNHATPPDADSALERDLRLLAHPRPSDGAFKDDLRALLLTYSQTSAIMPTSGITARENDMSLTSRTIGRPLPPRARPRLTRLYLLVAAALALGGAATYLHGQALPGRTSRQSIVLIPPRPAPLASITYEKAQAYGLVVNSTCGLDKPALPNTPDTVEQWTEYAAGGVVRRMVQRMTAANGREITRELFEGRNGRCYVPRFNTVVMFTASRGQGFSEIDAPLEITDLRLFEAAARRGTIPNTHLRPPTTLNGVPVRVIETRNIESLPPGAPKGIKPAQDVYIWYYEPGSYAVRGHDALFIDGHGVTHVVAKLRVTVRRRVSYATLRQADFRLVIPTSAHQVVQNTPVTLAQAVATPRIPAPLLGRDLGGMQLYQLNATHVRGQPYAAYRYSVGARVLGNFDVRPTLLINISTRSPSEQPLTTTATRSPTPGTQLLHLQIAGRHVIALYTSMKTDNAGLAHGLFFAQDGFDIDIQGSDLSRRQFFNLVAALVDGHHDPHVVVHLQAELNAP